MSDIQQRIEEAGKGEGWSTLEHTIYLELKEAIKVISELEERVKRLENKEKLDHERIVQV